MTAVHRNSLHIVGCAFVALGLLVSGISCEERSLNICELLSHVTRYNGRKVTVVGILSTGLEDSSLRPYGCGKAGELFPNGIWLEMRADARVSSAKELVSAARGRTPGCHLVARVTGLVDLEPIVIDYGTSKRVVGHGHLGAYKGKILVEQQQVIDCVTLEKHDSGK